MKITVKAREGQGPDEVILLSVEGSATAMDFEGIAPNPLDVAVGPDWRGRRLAMGLSGVTVIGSPGIGWLVATHFACRRNGGKLVLHSLSEIVHAELKMVGLLKLLHVAADAQEARRMLAETAC